MDPQKKIDETSWILLFTLSIVWGCSFILIKKSLIAFSPVQLACLRLGISSLAFTPIVYYHRRQVPWHLWPKFLAAGLTGSGIPAFLFFFAQTQVTSSVAGLLNSLTPIWTMIIGYFVFNLHFTRKKMFGVILGFVGATSLIVLGNDKLFGSNPLFGLLIVLATICYASSVNIVQAFFKDVKPIIISSMSFFLIGPLLLVYLFLTDFMSILQQHESAYQALGAVTLLSLLGTVVASIMFYHLVQRTSAVFGSTVTYLMPIIAIFWGLADGESITILHFTGMAMILIGVYFTKS